ncbi:alpha/beta fold hydrolase [Tsukamurella soli]|uniref:Alpha/beta hydrolase n=1 Tax=Tsukamurella soli TaxID=644556 RepID=A0ABP8J0D9_9ACTN
MTIPVATLDGFTAGYVEAGGLRTWHEVRGDGPPVLLLHGGLAGALGWWGQAQALVDAGFRVHVPERRGHAHTPDVDGPLTYAVMADDTIAYLDAVVSRPAHLVGWSDGAVVALLVAQRRPDLVDRMVLIGQYYNSDGRITDGDVDDWLRSDDAVALLRQGYDPYSPDGPDHFGVVYEKVLAMWEAEPEIELASLSSVASPTLVLQGDRDEVSVAHSLAVVEALGDARLAVLPGSHLLPLESPAVVNPLLLWFLHADAVDPGFAVSG